MLIKLYPIYRTLGPKHHKNYTIWWTPTPSRTYEEKCFIGEIKDIDDYEFIFPSMCLKKKVPGTLNKIENIQNTSD